MKREGVVPTRKHLVVVAVLALVMSGCVLNSFSGDAVEPLPDTAGDVDFPTAAVAFGEDPVEDGATLTALSPSVEAVIVDGTHAELTTAVGLPEELIPDEPVAYVSAAAITSWSSGRSHDTTVMFVAHDTGDDGDRFVQTFIDAGWAEADREMLPDPLDGDNLTDTEAISFERETSAGVDRAAVYVVPGPSAGTVQVTLTLTVREAEERRLPAVAELGFVHELHIPEHAEVGGVNSSVRVPSAPDSPTRVLRETHFFLEPDDYEDWLDEVRDGALVDGRHFELIDEEHHVDEGREWYTAEFADDQGAPLEVTSYDPTGFDMRLRGRDVRVVSITLRAQLDDVEPSVHPSEFGDD